MALAAPSIRGEFSFSGDTFCVSTSSHVHRRCTMPELKAHFKALGSAKDHPGHWYEAQLLHYGLPPSKVKGTAKMRLMEAVSAGRLTVPPHLATLERELKKEWTASNKKAVAAAKKPPAAKATQATKRKAEELRLAADVGGSSFSVSVTVNHELESKPSKKAKKSTAPRPPPSQESRRPAATTPLPKQTARRGGRAPPPAREAVLSSPAASPPARKQTARRGNFTIGRGVKREPAVKDEYGRDSSHSYLPADHALSQQPWWPGPQSSSGGSFVSGSDAAQLPPLGLLNGQYEIFDTYFPRGGVDLLDDDRWLVCTIDGDQLWVSFDLAFVHGVMRRASRPRRSSSEPLLFNWCGEDDDYYRRRYDESHQCRMTFLGDGLIEADFDWDGRQVSFKARRLEGQSTRSGISGRAMWEQWNEFREG